MCENFQAKKGGLFILAIQLANWGWPESQIFLKHFWTFGDLLCVVFGLGGVQKRGNLLQLGPKIDGKTLSLSTPCLWTNWTCHETSPTNRAWLNILI